MAILAGCARGDRVGERVELRMLNIDALDNYANKGESAKFLDSLTPFEFPEGFTNDGKHAKAQFEKQVELLRGKQWLPNDKPNTSTETAADTLLLPVVAPLLVGAAIDFVVTTLDETADSFEAQWGTSRMVDGWWWNGVENKEAKPKGENTVPKVENTVPKVENSVPKVENTEPKVENTVPKVENTKEATVNHWRPKFVGVEIVRSTSKFPASSGGASRLVLLFLPSKSDKRLFVVYPLFYGNRSPKASVGTGGQSLAATISMSVNATWVGNDRAVQAEVAQAVFDVTGYSTSTPGAAFWRMPDRDSVGWFAAGPAAAPTPRISSSAAGVFRIAVAVTEKDEGESRQWIERASKYVTDNREKVIEAVKGGAEGTK